MPEKPLQTSELYSDNEIAEWREGWSMFLENFGDIQPSMEITSASIGQLIALFMGEKPAIFKSPFRKHRAGELMAIGLGVDGDFIYRRELVQSVMDKHKQIFARYGLHYPEQVINFLNKANIKEHNIIRGLTLGIPFASVMDHENKRNFGDKTTGINIHGIQWVDYAPSEESAAKQKRLRDAFRISGAKPYIESIDREYKALEAREAIRQIR